MTVMLATFMEVLDTSVANVALPHIAGGLSVDVQESTWALTAYLVSNAIVLPLTGWLAPLFGRKNVYMTCVGLFTLSSFLCGIAPSLNLLILFRIFQGIGGGALQPISQAILLESFPPQKRGLAMAVFGMGVVVAPIVGPTLGGWLTDNISWRWIFFINLPVGLLSMFLTSLLIFDPPYLVRRGWRSVKIDYFGLGLIAVGLGCLQIFLDKGQIEDWFASRLIMVTGAIALVCLSLLIVWELFHESPIMNLRLLRDRNFAVGVLTMFVIGFTLYGSILLLPVFLQQLLGYTATLAGMALSPGGFFTLLMMPVAGALVGRVQARYLSFGTADRGLFSVLHGRLHSPDRFLARRHGPHHPGGGPGLSVRADQCRCFLLHPQRADRPGHGHHQSGAQHRRQLRHRVRHDGLGPPDAVLPEPVDPPFDALESGL